MDNNGLRHFIIGHKLATSQGIHERLSKTKALAVFSSDALSSTAYATEAIMLVLIAAGSGALSISLGIAFAIAALMLIVSFSYYQTIHAYPNGGGAYIVTKENLGTNPSLVAAAALLIDYILTVAVSVSAGVSNLSSAFPALEPFRVEIALLIIVLVTFVNLRGVRESGTFFAIPTYAFVVGVFIMLGVGLFKIVTGSVPAALPETTGALGQAKETLNTLSLFLILRAFAGGCTALTGIEAISNGIPAFKPPESQNAGKTLIVMVIILSTMFLGITILANSYPVELLEGESHKTVIAQIATQVFGEKSLLFYYMQFSTLLILSLAANTAYADFPRLASLIARDRFLPRQLTNLGDRLVFSNGIVLLAVLASFLVVLFNAQEHNLLPLYAVGVFISFTLSQSGMVVHWFRERSKEGFVPTTGWRFRLGMNAIGALLTAIVFLILLITKFAEGAWIVAVTIPLLVFTLMGIHRHYQNVAQSLTLDGIQPFALGPETHASTNLIPVVVLLNSLNRASLQALEYAVRFTNNVRAVTIGVEEDAVDALKRRWNQWNMQIPLDIIDSPYREVAAPLLGYLHERDQEQAEDVQTAVVIPEFVVQHWWERFLHNQTAHSIRAMLYEDQISAGRGRPVIIIPYRIGEGLYEPEFDDGLPGRATSSSSTEQNPKA